MTFLRDFFLALAASVVPIAIGCGAAMLMGWGF